MAKPKQVAVVNPGTFGEVYTPGTYTSAYGDQLNSALDKVTNWSYDPLQDASYVKMAGLYNEKGKRAAADTLGQAASLNGGYGTSYAVSAAQQARNQYNQELAAYASDLEDRAYNRANNTLSALRAADDTAYGRFRDTESDRKYQYEQNYNKYRDALSNYQWAMGYNVDVYNATKKGSSGGGGRSSGGKSSGSTKLTQNQYNAIPTKTTNALDKNIADRTAGSKVTLGAGKKTTTKKK